MDGSLQMVDGGVDHALRAIGEFTGEFHATGGCEVGDVENQVLAGNFRLFDSEGVFVVVFRAVGSAAFQIPCLHVEGACGRKRIAESQCVAAFLRAGGDR